MTERDTTRDDESIAPARPFSTRTLTLHGRPNWTAVLFFFCLCGLHLYISIHAFTGSRWEGVMSFLLGSAFLIVGVLCCFARTHLDIEPGRREILIRSGVGWVCVRRRVSFDAIRAVRLTLASPPEEPMSRIEILCEGEDILVPPTTIPRQEALYLALVFGVQLIKVSNGGNEGIDVRDRGSAERSARL